MRPRPQVDLVLGDLGKRSSLEGVGVVSSHVQPSGVVKTVDPVLAVGLVTLDGTNVVGFTVIVPGDDLDDVDRAAVGDDSLPAFVVQVVVRHVDPLEIKNQIRGTGGKILECTHVLVEGVRSIVSEEPRGDSSHIGLGIAWHLV